MHYFLVVAFQGCGENAVLADLGIVFANEGKALPVRGECNGAVDVLHNGLWRASQYRSSIKDAVIAAGIQGFEEIDVVPIRGKDETAIIGMRRRDDLGIAACGHVAQPEALKSVVVLHAKHVPAIRRNGSQCCLA